MDGSSALDTANWASGRNQCNLTQRLWLPQRLSRPQISWPAPQSCIWPGSQAETPPWRVLGCREDLTPTAKSLAGPEKLAVRAGTAHIPPVPDISGAWRNFESLWNFLSIRLSKCHQCVLSQKHVRTRSGWNSNTLLVGTDTAQTLWKTLLLPEPGSWAPRPQK